MIALFALFAVVGLLYFGLRIASMLWRGVEQVLNEIVSGVRLFFVLAWRAFKLAARAWRQTKRVGRCIARRVHAALFTWGYVLKRRYLAAEMRRVRRERHA